MRTKEELIKTGMEKYMRVIITRKIPQDFSEWLEESMIYIEKDHPQKYQEIKNLPIKTPKVPPYKINQELVEQVIMLLKMRNHHENN
ncbi:MAG: hypothetical protein J6P44_01720 [Bacteroidales bacterium]|nr:hypothetical protein [Bacteroidales bacterium]